jgi:predicted tellurium resistance membrane protein TerC
VFGFGLTSSSLAIVFIALAASLFAMGLCYGPLGGWLPRLFPVELRYSGISVAFSAGGVIGGALVPMAATALAARGDGAAVGLLMSAAGLLSLMGVALARPAGD